MRKIWILVLAIIMFMSIEAYGDNIIDMMPALEETKRGVLATLTTIDRDLIAAAKRLSTVDHNSQEARDILLGVCKNRPYVYDCAIIDISGKLKVMEPEISRKYEGRDVSWQPQVNEVFRTKVPVMSRVFRSLDNINRIDFEYPIFNNKGEFIGAVSLLLRHDLLLGEVIAPLVEGKSYKIWVMQTDGVVIYDPDPDQINKNIFTDSMFLPFGGLKSFSKTVVAVPSGAGSYEFYKDGYMDKTIVKKYSMWDTVSLYGNQWRIVVMEIGQSQPVPKEATKLKP